MSPVYRSFFFMVCLAFGLISCGGSHENTSQNNQANTPQASNQTAQNEYQDFILKFRQQVLPLALPGNTDDDTAKELDKKYIKDILSVNFSPAFGTEDILPGLADNMDAAKYYPCGKVSLDSFSGYIVRKEGEDDYYFLCLFDKQGKFTDGMCIAFKEGTDDDGTMREASVNDDGSIEISQYNLIKGKPDKEDAERHFYEITNDGKIRDLKNDAAPAHT